MNSDPKLSTSKSGIEYCWFVVSVKSERVDKSTGKSKIQSFPITVYGEKAKYVATNLKKGEQVEIVGKLTCKSSKDDRGWKSEIQIEPSSISKPFKLKSEGSEAPKQEESVTPLEEAPAMPIEDDSPFDF